MTPDHDAPWAQADTLFTKRLTKGTTATMHTVYHKATNDGPDVATVAKESAKDAAQRRAEANWKQALADFFRRVSSTLADKTVPVCWLDPSSYVGDGIAFTNGEEIYINPKFFSEAFKAPIKKKELLSTVGPIAALKGATYHELAHILYTPRTTEAPTRLVIAEESVRAGAYFAFNILEDQRIERLMVAKYQTLTNYFIPMVSRFMLDTSPVCTAEPGMVFPFVYGRRYMGRQVIDAARIAHQAFIDTHGLCLDPADLEDTIDEYRGMVFYVGQPKAETERAFQLVKAFQAYYEACQRALAKDGKATGRSGDTATDGGIHSGISQGTPMPKSQQQADNDAADEYDGAVEDAEDDEDAAAAEGHGDDSEVAGGSGQSDGSDLGQALLEAAESANTKTEDSDIDTLGTIIDAASTSKPNMKPDLYGATLRDVLPVMRHASKTVQDAFVAIRSEGEEVWERGQDYGKLNPMTAMGARGRHFDVFDQWTDLGDDANSIEVVVLVDQSGSMTGYKQVAVSAGVWIIRNACQALDVPVSVIGFGDEACYLFGADTKATLAGFHAVRAGGGTRPESALDWASSVFTSSPAKKKLLFMLTDGQFSYSYKIQNLMSDMKKAGVDTTLITQGAPSSPWISIEDHLNNGVPFADFGFEATPKHQYGFHRALKVGDALRELPKAISIALNEVARHAITA